MELERTPTATSSKLLRVALRSASTPVREVAYNPVSHTAKPRLREAVSCLRPHSLQGQTKSCHPEPLIVHL